MTKSPATTTSKKKIRILVPIRYPVGGIRTYLKYTYGKLDRNRYEFDFVAPSKKWLNRIKLDLTNFKVIIHPVEEKNSSRALMLSIFALLKRKNYQIIHSQGYTAGILANIANIRYGIPHIITLHHVFGHGQHSDTFWAKFRWLKRHFIQFILSYADRIQTVSDDAMSNLLEYFPGLQKRKEKLIVIKNGIGVWEFLRDNKTKKNLLHKQKDIFYLGFLGRYMPEKGFPFIIDVMESLVKNHGKRNFRVISVGGFGGFIREYRKNIDSRGLSEYFVFLDFMQTVAQVIKEFDVLLIPSLGEACGLVPMEGLICGTPIIAFSCIGLREILKDTPAIMVEVKDTEKMANKIIEVVNEYDVIKRTFTNFIPIAKERFDVNNCAKKLENEILQLCK